jgi:hypothetical protein
VPKFCNPSDFLIKLAHDPALVSHKITTKKLNSKAIGKFSQIPEKNEKDLHKFINIDSRSAPVFEQLKELFIRLMMLSLRSPKVMLILFGISLFVSFLIIAVFGGVGGNDMNLFDRAQSQRTVMNWVGYCVYANQDAFAASFFANIVTIPTFMPVFKREFKSGLYSPSVFYFGNWATKMFCLSFYPMIVTLAVFPFLDLKD